MKYCLCMAVFVLVCGCAESSDAQRQRAAYDDYLAEGKAQNREFARQLEVSAAQLEVVAAQQLKAGEQGQRYDALLDKWEEQARRVDVLLDRWENVIGTLEQRSAAP